MVRISLYFTAAVFLLTVSCKSGTNVYNIEDTIIADTLLGKEVLISKDLLMPTKVLSLENHLVVFDQTGDDLFSVFNLPDLELQYSFGKKGNGPNEFVNIDPNSLGVLDGNLVLLDNNKVVTIQITNNEAKRISTKPLQLEGNPINRLVMINDSIYITDMLEGNYEYRMSNIRSGVDGVKFGEYPANTYGISNDIERYQVFKKAPVVNPKNTKFAVFYLYHNKMRIYDDGILELEVNISHDLGDYSVGERSNVIFRAEPTATQENIYTLNIEKPKSEIDFSSFLPRIELWDWEGNLKAKYPLNKPILSFCVSEKFKKIYATSLESTNKILVFDLPDPLAINTGAEYKQVENDFYTVSIPIGLEYATASPAEEKNKVTSYKELFYNSCYFVNSVRGATKPAFKGTLAIVVSTLMKRDKDNYKLEEFVKDRDKNIKRHTSKYDTSIFVINENQMIIADFELEGVDPKGESYLLKTRKWRWQEQEKFMEIEYSSSEDFELYVNSIEYIVKSFRLKPGTLIHP